MNYYAEVDGTHDRMNSERTVKVWLPSILRGFTGGETWLSLTAGTIHEVLEGLIEAYPDLRTHLIDEMGRLHSFVAIFRNDENIRDLRFMDTELKGGDELRILPAVAGG